MLPELTAIALSFASLHLPYDDENYINPGVHLEAENYRAGIYRNSNRTNLLPHTTYYVGYTVPLGSKEIGGVPIKLGLLAALGHGYESPLFGGLELRVGARLVAVVIPDPVNQKLIAGLAVRFPIKE